MARPGPKLSKNPGKTAKYYRAIQKLGKNTKKQIRRLTALQLRKSTDVTYLRYVESEVLHRMWIYPIRTAGLSRKVGKQNRGRGGAKRR